MTNPSLGPFMADKGIYVSGDGSQSSKDLLKTYDGYAYAIPLFRVKRRNSSGYREDNLNGARDYFKANNVDSNPGIYVTITPNSNVLTVTNWNGVDYTKVKAGIDKISWSGIKYSILAVTSTTVVLGGFSVGSSYTNYPVYFTVESDRPDGKIL
jgi:hypothetical protein